MKNQVPLEEHILYAGEGVKIFIPQISILRVELIGTHVRKYFTMPGNWKPGELTFEIAGQMGGGFPRIIMTVNDLYYKHIEGPDRINSLTLDENYNFIGKVRLSFGGYIETCNPRTTEPLFR